jgi:hypothetical protein
MHLFLKRPVILRFHLLILYKNYFRISVGKFYLFEGRKPIVVIGFFIYLFIFPLKSVSVLRLHNINGVMVGKRTG